MMELPIVLGLGLLGLLVAWRFIAASPPRGLLILAALVPFNGIVPVLGLPGIVSGWKEGLILLTLAAAIRYRLRTPHPAPRIVEFAPWIPAAAALVVLGAVSALTVFHLAGILAIKITFFYMVTVTAILWLAPFSATDRDRLVTVLMVTGVVTSFLGLAQQVAGPQRMIELGFQYGQQVRAAGGLFRTFSTFNQPFPFALFVMTSLLVGGAVALADPGRRRNLLFLVCTPVMAVAMTTSIVRASILGLIIGMVWLGVLRFRILLGVLGAAAAVLALAVPMFPAQRVSALISGSSLTERSDGWTAIFDSILKHPFGIGLGSTGSAADSIAVAGGGKAGVRYQPDNYYVKLLVELGPLGLWFFVTILVIALVGTIRAAQRLTGPDAALALGVSASLVATVFASFVATYFEIFPLDVYFWLLLGAVACAVPARPADGASPALVRTDRASVRSTEPGEQRSAVRPRKET